MDPKNLRGVAADQLVLARTPFWADNQETIGTHFRSHLWHALSFWARLKAPPTVRISVLASLIKTISIWGQTHVVLMPSYLTYVTRPRWLVDPCYMLNAACLMPCFSYILRLLSFRPLSWPRPLVEPFLVIGFYTRIYICLHFESDFVSFDGRFVFHFSLVCCHIFHYNFSGFFAFAPYYRVISMC